MSESVNFFLLIQHPSAVQISEDKNSATYIQFTQIVIITWPFGSPYIYMAHEAHTFFAF